MRRSQLVKLVGLSEEAFNLLKARKHVPMRGRPPGSGWQNFTVEDAIAFEAAVALARCGVKKNNARAWVDLYFDVAIERASENDRKSTDPVYLGVVTSFGIAETTLVADDQFPLVGSASDIASELQSIQEALGQDRWLDGLITINLNLCVQLVYLRAEQALIADDRLEELATLFGARSRMITIVE